MPDRPPIYTLMTELCGWTFDRTASLPKSQRFTFGQRLDNLTLDALHVASALAAREDAGDDDAFAVLTHDRRMARAATALGVTADGITSV